MHQLGKTRLDPGNDIAKHHGKKDQQKDRQNGNDHAVLKIDHNVKARHRFHIVASPPDPGQPERVGHKNFFVVFERI